MKLLSRHLLATCVLALLAGGAAAAPTTYVIDESHTFPRFSYSHLGYSTQLSTFNKTTGSVVFDPVARTGSVEVVIDMKSVSTGSEAFNGHIQGEDFLHTAKYPTATFKSTQVVFDGDRPKSIEGLLSIKGVTRPVTLTVTSFLANQHPMQKRPAIGANAFTTIKRSDFNAGKFAPHVGDELRIDIGIEAIAR